MVAETQCSCGRRKEVWSEGERDEFVLYIAGDPEAGAVIPDMGGVRKLRWGRAGSGKRGGVRVIYFYHDPDQPLYLLMGRRERTAGRFRAGRSGGGARVGRFDQRKATRRVAERRRRWASSAKT